MRSSRLNVVLSSHMQAHAWRTTHTNTQTASPPPHHPCWHFGEKYPPPTPIYLPPLQPTPPPVAADVPRSVAYHLLPPHSCSLSLSLSPNPPPPSRTTHTTPLFATKEDLKSHMHNFNQTVHTLVTLQHIRAPV